MTAKLVKARQKKFDDLPDWIKCCSAMQQRAREIEDDEFVAEVRVFLADAICPHCGRIRKDAPYRRTVAPIKTVICVESYDLDEGPTA